MKIIFNDGTEEFFDKAEQENCTQEDNFYLVKDEDEEIIVEINVDFIRMIRWVI